MTSFQPVAKVSTLFNSWFRALQSSTKFTSLPLSFSFKIMAKQPQDDSRFEALVQKINQETNSARKKIEILFDSRGFFSAQQAARIMHTIAAPSDKVKAIQVMEPRLVRMTCSDARDVIGGVSVHNDKLIALNSIKRALVDCNTRLGKEFILSSFPYEEDKMKALSILATVRYDVADQLPAGGHQGYAAVGGLFTQCKPLEPHLFGSVQDQLQQLPGKGAIKIPHTAKPGVIPSVYTGHPSYAYPRDKTYAEERGYAGVDQYPGRTDANPPYPAGAPPLSFKATGAPAPTGWPGLEMREPSFQRMLTTPSQQDEHFVRTSRPALSSSYQQQAVFN